MRCCVVKTTLRRSQKLTLTEFDNLSSFIVTDGCVVRPKRLVAGNVEFGHGLVRRQGELTRCLQFRLIFSLAS